ncbi:hypothetical protein P7F88_20280 [Vibrio hannami]|uniref:hypothetical protein n=1 Tax=Vibrio hannami TaxID=2717094 RepID=UPI002410878F|nr:hypothetical protein [Vibrio hannami]MDG3088280.1 hypothetical protein [Vibrio hannami]
MIKKIKYEFNKKFYNLALRAVKKLPPIEIKEELDFTLLSVCSHSDLIQYLFALRSFCENTPPKRIFILSDGSLTAEDRKLLMRLNDRITISEANDVVIDGTPSYISWRRLTKIVELVNDSYVVQLDSDVVVRRLIPELNQCIKNQTSFIHGTLSGKKITDKVSAQQYGEAIKRQGFTNLQTYCEAALNKTDDKVISKYVRGSGGLYGIPKKAINQQSIKSISEQYHIAVGEKWFGWGSEQVAVNTLIANQDNANVLNTDDCGIPKFENMAYTNSLSIVHFIGTIRFVNMVYYSYCKELLNKWQQLAH